MNIWKWTEIYENESLEFGAQVLGPELKYDYLRKNFPFQYFILLGEGDFCNWKFFSINVFP